MKGDMKNNNHISVSHDRSSDKTQIKLAYNLIPDGKFLDMTVERVIQTVAQYFEIKGSDIIGKERTANIVIPRQIAMFLCRCLTSLSISELGAYFGRNSATVLHAVQKVEKEIDRDEKVKQTVGRLKRLLQVKTTQSS